MKYIGITLDKIAKMLRHYLDIVQDIVNNIRLMSGHDIEALIDETEIWIYDFTSDKVLIRSPVTPSLKSVINELHQLQGYWYYEQNFESLTKTEHKIKHLLLRQHFYGQKERNCKNCNSIYCYTRFNSVGH